MNNFVFAIDWNYYIIITKITTFCILCLSMFIDRVSFVYVYIYYIYIYIYMYVCMYVCVYVSLSF